jgi:ABC-type glutathione transport system ATPase component
VSADASPLLELARVSKTFRNAAGASVTAVRSVSLTLRRGETLALVGESGSGKSTLGRIALGLIKPDAGDVLLEGRSLASLSNRAFREARTAMQPIFQDATASLNPRRTVRQLMGQALRRHGPAIDAKAAALLDSVGLRPGLEYLDRLPHELSGGQRQRLAIARALAIEPALIIADEPLSGADVSIRGQVLNVLLDIKAARGIAYLMITHDLSIARAFADRVAVMLRGEIVESGPVDDVLGDPRHDYTRRLLAAVPRLDAAAQPLATGDVRRSAGAGMAPDRSVG